jgi:citronellol/citronellal dehydrogenase
MAGRVAIVTGASRGIGAAIADRFAREGASVVVAARTLDRTSPSPYPGTLADTMTAIRDAGGRALAVRCDLTSSPDRQRLVDEARQEFGPIDVLVNNAAASWAKPFEDLSAKQYQVMFDVHVRSAFELAQLVVPDMRATGRGWILNMTSRAAAHPEGPPYSEGDAAATTLVYSMCKVALERFTTGLAAHLWAQHIAVNALGPSKAVLTYGMNHPPVDPTREDLIEPALDTAAAALELCTADPLVVTGRVTDTEEVLRARSDGA